MRTNMWQGQEFIGLIDFLFLCPFFFFFFFSTKALILSFLRYTSGHYAQLTKVHDSWPDKFILATEACEGDFPINHVKLGDWSRAESYVSDIMDGLFDEKGIERDKQNIHSFS